MARTAIIIGQPPLCARLERQLDLLDERPITIGWVACAARDAETIADIASPQSPLLGTIEQLETIIERTAPDLALVTLPALAYCLLLATTAVNVPYLDDYDTILRFLLETREAEGKPLKLLFSQHVEHRLVLLRATALAMAGITGHVDFIAFAWIGFLGLAFLAAGLFASWMPGAQ